MYSKSGSENSIWNNRKGLKEVPCTPAALTHLFTFIEWEKSEESIPGGSWDESQLNGDSGAGRKEQEASELTLLQKERVKPAPLGEGGDTLSAS